MKPRDQGIVVWLSGLSGSGKTTITSHVTALLERRGVSVATLDGDVVRSGLSEDLGFTAADRRENLRRVAHVAKILSALGHTVLVPVIAPYQADRLAAKQICGEPFIGVYVDTPLAVCEQRDPKGLYAMARRGEIERFTGISAPYQTPQAPFLDLTVTGDGALELDHYQHPAALVCEAIEEKLRRNRNVTSHH